MPLNLHNIMERGCVLHGSAIPATEAFEAFHVFKRRYASARFSIGAMPGRQCIMGPVRLIIYNRTKVRQSHPRGRFVE